MKALLPLRAEREGTFPAARPPSQLGQSPGGSDSAANRVGRPPPTTGPGAARKRPLQAPPAPAGWVSATGRRHGPPTLASREPLLRPHGAPGLPSAAGERWRRATPLRGLGGWARRGSRGSCASHSASYPHGAPCGVSPLTPSLDAHGTAFLPHAGSMEQTALFSLSSTSRSLHHRKQRMQQIATHPLDTADPHTCTVMEQRLYPFLQGCVRDC